MRRLAQHLLLTLAGVAAIAAAGVTVDINASYWALATCGLATISQIVAHQWLPPADTFVRRYVALFFVSLLLVAITAALVLGHHGARAALVGAATFLGGLLGFRLGGGIWLARWTVLRARRRISRRLPNSRGSED